MHRGDVSAFNQGQISTKTPSKINSEYQSKEVGWWGGVGVVLHRQMWINRLLTFGLGHVFATVMGAVLASLTGHSVSVCGWPVPDSFISALFIFMSHQLLDSWIIAIHMERSKYLCNHEYFFSVCCLKTPNVLAIPQGK